MMSSALRGHPRVDLQVAAKEAGNVLRLLKSEWR